MEFKAVLCGDRQADGQSVLCHLSLSVVRSEAVDHGVLEQTHLNVDAVGQDEALELS